MEFRFRGPVPNTLRAGIRRLFPALFQHRILKMPLLETERIALRPFTEEDFEAIAAWDQMAAARDPAAAAKEFLDYCLREYRERGIGPWAIQRKDTGTLAGNCGFPTINFKARCGEVNCHIAPSHRRHGLAKEALLALFVAGFEQFALTRIEAVCNEDNLNSQGLAEKAGMRFERYLESVSSAKKKTRRKLYSITKQDLVTKGCSTAQASFKLAYRPAPRTED